MEHQAIAVGTGELPPRPQGEPNQIRAWPSLIHYFLDVILPSAVMQLQLQTSSRSQVSYSA